MSNRYVRFNTIAIPVFLPLIEAGADRINIGGHEVGRSSLRLQTFKAYGTTCVVCGLEASFFAVEAFHHSPDGHRHVNLWGRRETGEEVLFTSDHRVAKVNGGIDGLSNRQTMCSPCNAKKGETENPQHKVKKAKS